MDQYRSRLKLSENFERHWSILISGEIHMDQPLVHSFSWGNSYGPKVLKVFRKFPPTLVLVHGWLFPVCDKRQTTYKKQVRDIFWNVSRNCFCRILSPKCCIMRSFVLKYTCSLTSQAPERRKKVPASPQKVTDLDFVKPPSQGVLNNAKPWKASGGDPFDPALGAFCYGQVRFTMLPQMIAFLTPEEYKRQR